MGHGLQTDNPTIAAAFRAALDHQLLALVILGVLLAVAWNVARTVHYRRAVAAGTLDATVPDPWSYPEPAARRLLRISFGLLWVFDGLLQIQGSMPLGLPGSVLTPAGSSSPGWVQHLVNVGTTIWTDHPVSAAAATVWIQVGIGVFLLVAPRGYWSRSAGAVSAGWGLVVWVFGEAFGGVFSHGSSWMFGLPGAVLFYAVAGVLVTLPDRSWETPRLGKGLLRATGLFFVGMGILQAWPGRGFWSGQPHASAPPGTLTSMVQQMSQVSQPSVFSSWVRSFGAFQAGHGWLVNFLVVVVLVGVGACFLSGNLRLIRIGVAVGAVLCLADWVLVEDLGFFGGVGTDPNSMIPMVLVFTGGYVAMAHLPVRAQAGHAVPAGAAEGAPVEGATAAGPEAEGAGAQGVPTPAGWLDRITPSYLLRSLLAVGAVGILLVGAGPMAMAATNPNADPILTEAANGSPNIVDVPASPFTLTDQHGRQVSLASLAGRTVVLTFLDPVCTSDCPLIAQELRLTDRMLGSTAARVELVAVVNNPLDNTTAFTSAFDRQEGLDQLPNWKYLTGSLDQLHSVWDDYGVQTQVSPAGGMIAHSDILYIIDRSGHTREIIDSDPGAGTSAGKSSFASLLSGQVQHIAQA
jgi:cytochrome oxidase Cu insertion factor (SCO1/SenC/PrrC family)